MAYKIQVKRSAVEGKLPTPNDLDYGELAINYASAHESLSFKNSENKVVTLGMNVKQTTGDDEISPISQKALTSAIKEGVNNVTTLVNVPVDKRLVYATLTKDETISFDTSKYASCFQAFDKGAQIKIIAFNNTTSEHNIILPFTESEYICFVKNIKVPVNSYGIITVDYDGTSIYVNAEVKERAEGYIGGEAIIALSNTDGDIKYVKNSKLKAFKDNSENNDYDPIGIVVIPKSHTQVILSDGDPRKGCNIVMSLKPMNCNTPVQGGMEAQSIYYSHQYMNQILPHYDQVAVFGNSSQNSIGGGDNGYLPSDDFVRGTASKDCPSIKYNIEASTNNNKMIPSPYVVIKDNGEWGTSKSYFSQSTVPSTTNALSDFDGPNNTNILTSLANEGWKTATIISNVTTAGSVPAACCCARFRTKGTISFADSLHIAGEDPWKRSHVWYMPACGEIGYIMPNFKANNEALTNIRQLYGNGTDVAFPLSVGKYCSSTECSNSKIRYVNVENGIVAMDERQQSYYVRAFCALP